MNRPVKLLIVVNDANFFISHRLPIALAARKAGYEVHVATAFGTGEEQIQAQGFSFHPLPLTRSGGRVWQELRAFMAIYKLYRQLAPDIVHHVTIKPVLYGGVAARLAGVPAVVSAISGLGYVFIATGLRAAILRFLIQEAYRLALGHPRSRVIFQNPDDMQEFLDRRLVDEKACVLIRGSGVNVDEFRPMPEPDGPMLVVLPARMLRDKGAGEFVEAARMLKAQGLDARFVLAGDCDEGNPAAIAKQQLEIWQSEGVVEWWGRCEDMPRVFAEAHVVCLPSYREGVPKALLEAAASGRPIVTTDVPGCREVVKNGENGLLVPARDSHALAVAIKSLLDDMELRRKMGRRSREIAEREFSIGLVVDRTLQVYEALGERRLA